MFRFFAVTYFVKIALFASYACASTIQDGDSAGCIIRTHDAVILVRDVWTNKLSVPGGHRHKSESPQKAAERETLEETGIIATATRQVGTFRGFRLYSCTPTNSISFVGRNARVPSTASVETKEIILLPLSELSPETVRYSKQISLISEGFIRSEVASPFLIEEKETGLRLATPWQLASIHFSKSLQAAVPPVLAFFLKIGSLLAEVPIFFIVIVYFWLPKNKLSGPYISILVLISLMINILLKYKLSEPRPFDLDPNLKLSSASGYGLPSGHAQFATLFWGLICLEFNNRKFWHYIAYVATVIYVCISRVFLGVHFIHDVLLGALIGLALLALWIKLKAKFITLFSDSGSYFTWLVALWVTVPAIYYLPNPEIISTSACLYGLLSGLTLFKNENFRVKHTEYSFKNQFYFYFIVLTVLFGMGVLYRFLLPPGGNSLPHILGTFLYYYLLGLWLSSARKIL